MSACEVTQDLAHIADGRFAEQRRRGEDFQHAYEAERDALTVLPEPAKPRWFRRHAA